jgi:hypothetical protein
MSAKLATLPPSTAKRSAVVSSPEFLKLFEAARQKFRDPKRETCKHGHPICAANAHVGDLKRTGYYFCNACNVQVQASYKAKPNIPSPV